MILVIDNFDSYVHNLARYIREGGRETKVIRNNAISVDECLLLPIEGVVIGPGPKRPADVGLALALIRALPSAMPFLGVCLGHQCLVEVFGGDTCRANHPLHGEASAIRHTGTGIFQNIPSPTPVGRYHSLIAAPAQNSPLEETAWNEDGELMAVAHRSQPWFGVQFHPESLLTPQGHAMIENFLTFCDGRNAL